MPPLNDFIAELTQDKSNLFKMGAIKCSKNQALVAIDASKSSGKDKQKGKGKFPEWKKERSSQSSENSSEHKGKKKKERKIFIYYYKGFHLEENCMRNFQLRIVIIDISTGSQLAHGIADHGSRLYFFSYFVPIYISTAFMSQSNNIIRLWHEIFGHLNYKYFHQLNKENMVEGLPAIKFTSGVCQGCILGKHLEKKFDKGKAQRDSSPLGLIHSEIMGPFP
jgi:hypothetical protein